MKKYPIQPHSPGATSELPYVGQLKLRDSFFPLTNTQSPSAAEKLKLVERYQSNSLLRGTDTEVRQNTSVYHGEYLLLVMMLVGKDEGNSRLH